MGIYEVEFTKDCGETYETVTKITRTKTEAYAQVYQELPSSLGCGITCITLVKEFETI